jgi:hypothetical protein
MTLVHVRHQAKIHARCQALPHKELPQALKPKPILSKPTQQSPKQVKESL